MEHEQDTVLQLQEVIEQLRNVFPSEPGEWHGSGKHAVYNCINPGRNRGGAVAARGGESKHTAAWEGRLKGRGEELE